MADNTRPSFDDKNETVSDPVHSGEGEGTSTPASGTPVSGSACDKPPAGWICSRQRGHEGPCAASPVSTSGLPLGMDPEEANHGALILFDATKRRMGILLNTLVRLAESGDFALWAPLGAMDETFRSLDWTTVPPIAVAKFYKLVSMTLTTYGTKLDGHAVAVLASIKEGTALPEMPVWSGEDTTAMYDMVEQIFVDGGTA